MLRSTTRIRNGLEPDKSMTLEFCGYPRSDGRTGIRNLVVVAYLVECAHHVSREIQYPFREKGVHLIGFPGCYPNEYSHRLMESICTHPNVGAVLLVSLGCEGFDRFGLQTSVNQSDRPVETLVIQENSGTQNTVNLGRAWIEKTLNELEDQSRKNTPIRELTVGTICGGSDGTSGITANPAVGHAFDRLIDQQVCCIFEETGELIGCEVHMQSRAVTPELGVEIRASVEKAAKYYTTLGYSSFAPGNADGGLSTIEEKSLGAYSKSGTRSISGLIKPGDVPNKGGLYLLDVVPDGDVRYGFPNINDNAEIAELIACGCHLILFTTGRGSVVGSAVSPVIKVCANPETYRNLSGDMDIDAGRVLSGDSELDQIGEEIFHLVLQTADGFQTVSEKLFHQEFIMTYKSFDPIGPSCLPN